MSEVPLNPTTYSTHVRLPSAHAWQREYLLNV